MGHNINQCIQVYRMGINRRFEMSCAVLFSHLVVYDWPARNKRKAVGIYHSKIYYLQMKQVENKITLPL